MKINPFKEPDIKITKNGVLKISRLVTIVFTFALYIASDIVRIIMTGGLITDLKYWTVTLINIFLIITVMITVRQYQKDKDIEADADIQDYIGQINRGFKTITLKGFSKKLDDFLKKVNEENKYMTFLKNIQHKLVLLSRKKDKPKVIKKRTELNKLLETPKEKVLKMNIKYKKVTVYQLFSTASAGLVNDNEADLSTHETQDVAKMVGIRAVMLILFSAFTGTIIVDIIISGWGIIYSVLIKIYVLICSVNVAMKTGDDFVQNNVKTSLQKKMRYLTKFVYETQELKDILIPNEKVEKVEKIEDKEKSAK